MYYVHVQEEQKKCNSNYYQPAIIKIWLSIGETSTLGQYLCLSSSTYRKFMHFATKYMYLRSMLYNNAFERVAAQWLLYIAFF